MTNPAPRSRIAAGWIDVHHHISPPSYRRECGDKLGIPLQKWELSKALEDMDRCGVAAAVATTTHLNGRIDEPERRRAAVRGANDFAATIRSDHPSRFGIFLSLPLPDIEGSLSEIEYGMDVLKADGIGLYTSYHDKWLGDAYFAPLFEELDRRGAVCFVHPTTIDCCHELIPELGDPAIEYGTDTTRAIAKMVFSGSSQRYPGMRLIWSHGGGTMPFLIERFTRIAAMERFAKLLPQGFLAEAHRFFYETAFISNRVALMATRMVVPPDHLLFGSDFPYRSVTQHATALTETGLLDAAGLRATGFENVLRLLPQFNRGD